MIFLWKTEENIFVILPLRKAAITVPIPTDGIPGRRKKDAKAEPAVNKTSRQTLTEPKLQSHFAAMLFTRPSIGITAKPELIVKDTPMERIAQAKMERKIFAIMLWGSIKNNPYDVNSINKEYEKVRHN